jgi:curli biogenesis system outer membrane secretion channel CsgG
MRRAATVLCLLTMLAPAATGAAAPPLRVGVVPFDFATSDGNSSRAAASLAKLLRAQMIMGRQLQPVVLDVPAGARPPLAPDALVAAASGAEVQVVVAGTVLEATVSHSSNRLRLPRSGLGGSLTRVKAKVVLQIELDDPATGQAFDSFLVEGSNTDVGLGADIYTVLGSFEAGDNGWEKSPMGKALREAAQRASQQVARRAGKRAGGR